MNNEIFIKENFKVDDTHSKVRGFVFAYDENDNLVFTKENMIVKTGRQYIMRNGLNENSFKCAFLSTNGNMVTEGDALETDESKGLVSIGNESTRRVTTEIWPDDFPIDGIDNIVIPTNLDEKDYFKYNINYEKLEIQCLIVFNSTKIIEANSLGLIVNDGTNDILFSRVTFPTYYKSETQRLTFKYYIYF